MLGEWIVTRPKPSLAMLPQISRVEGSGMVNIMGYIPSLLTAEQALDLGHRLVEAAIGAEGRVAASREQKRGSSG